MQINFKKIFNWDIKSVSPIQAVMVPKGYRGEELVVEYAFDVEYKHHGTRHVVTDSDDERTHVIYGGAARAAQILHRDYVRRMNEQRAR